MRHLTQGRKLNRTAAHRKALLRNLACALIDQGQIRTTTQKAKELKSFIEKLVTKGKKDSLHMRRVLQSKLGSYAHVAKLISDISPRFEKRPGGYVRSIKAGVRYGDNAEMSIVEFVDHKIETEETKNSKPAKNETKKAA